MGETSREKYAESAVQYCLARVPQAYLNLYVHTPRTTTKLRSASNEWQYGRVPRKMGFTRASANV